MGFVADNTEYTNSDDNLDAYNHHIQQKTEETNHGEDIRN